MDALKASKEKGMIDTLGKAQRFVARLVYVLGVGVLVSPVGMLYHSLKL